MRKNALSLLTASLLGLSLLSTAVQAAPSLAERRAIATYQSDIYAGQLEAIQAAAGFAVPVEVQWDSLVIPGQAAKFGLDSFWTDVYFTPLAQALKAVAVDDMGRQALAAELKSIVVRFDEETAPASAYASGVQFEAGVLSINFRPFTNPDDVDARAKAIQQVLEARL